MYDLVANKGYGTKRHLQALQQSVPHAYIECPFVLVK
jgi:ribonuclease HII